jgi:hypothetical protein
LASSGQKVFPEEKTSERVAKMKIILSFPENGNNRRPEQSIDVETVPRKGELVSWEDSTNYVVDDVLHDFSGDNGNVHRVTV